MIAQKIRLKKLIGRFIVFCESYTCTNTLGRPIFASTSLYALFRYAAAMKRPAWIGRRRAMLKSSTVPGSSKRVPKVDRTRVNL